jgi:membrane fusion protein, multidrug efflux system
LFKRHFFLIAAACLIALMVLAAILRLTLGGDDKAAAGPRPGGGRGQQVATVAVAQRPFTDRVEVLGVARGARSVNITSSQTELITRVMFTDGQRVAAGTPLVELQAREEDASIIEAQAQVAQAQREAERYRTLADRGVAPRVTAEQAETALETAQAALSAARARRGDRVLRAPFAGVLGLTTVTPGTLISPGGIITTLDDTSTIRVDFPLPERYLGRLRPGTPITATADAYGQETFSGRIALIDTRVNEQTRAATARAEFANPGGRIRPGMMMRVVASQGTRQALAVPEAAVQYEGAGAFVYRIASGENGSTAQRVEVEAGAVEGGFVEILSGLQAGDQLVGSGLNRIQPGAPVTTGPARQGQRQAQQGQAGSARP